MAFDGVELPSGWRWARLGNVAIVNPRRDVIQRHAEQATSFIPMEAVDEETGSAAPRVVPFEQVRKGYTFFREGDVLFAKITPCMQNGKHAIAEGLLDGVGFGTTEFHVVRPSDQITADWIHWFLRRPDVLAVAKDAMTGAVGQQRVPPQYLFDLQLPIPPLPEQHRIIARWHELRTAVTEARRVLDAQISDLKALEPALLRAAFSGAL